MDVAKNITIIGAGLIGSLLGVVLQQKGYNVTIYERYLDIRAIPSLGRSINLVLTSRGLKALSLLGQNICAEVLELATPVTGRILHQDDGSKQFQRYGKDDTEHNWSISRFELNKFLINKAEQAGVKIHFDSKVVACDFEKGEITVERSAGQKQPSVIGGDLEEDTAQQVKASGSTKQTIHVGRIIGADGGGSCVRYALRDAGQITFSEEFVGFGYKEMIFPASTSTQMEAHGLHIWPRTAHFLMALINKDGSFTGTIYLPRTGEESFASLNTLELVNAFFLKYYKNALPLLGGLENAATQFLKNPIGLLGTVRTSKYNLGGRALLIGDAAHAIVPFFGQGTNCGFEDVFVLSNLLDQVRQESDFGAAFEQFNQQRKPNADAIAELSLQNMIEMQAKVASQKFLLMKQIENKIENLYPARFRSEYAMVCYGGFGNVTYRNALKLGKVQAKILEDIAQGVDSLEQVDMATVDKILEQRLLPYQKKLQVDLTTMSFAVTTSKL